MNNDIKLCLILEFIFFIIFITRIPNPLSLITVIPSDSMPGLTFILITTVLLIAAIFSLIIKD